MSFIRTTASNESTRYDLNDTDSATSGTGATYSGRTFSPEKITCTASRAFAPGPSADGRMGELVARTTALLRRAFPQSMGARLDFGAYRFDAEQRTLQLHGEAIGLKHREYELALFLFRNAGRLLSRTHLREAVWGDATDTPSRSLDTHMSRLRSKLELTEANGYTITAVYGVGYRLDAVNATALNRAPVQQRAAATETLSG